MTQQVKSSFLLPSPEFGPGGKREPVPTSCPLITMCMPGPADMCAHIQTNKRIEEVNESYCLVFFFSIKNRVSLCSSGWSGTLCRSGFLELTEICLPLPLECWDWSHAPPCLL